MVCLQPRRHGRGWLRPYWGFVTTGTPARRWGLRFWWHAGAGGSTVVPAPGHLLRFGVQGEGDRGG